jgi:hypothetical protein
MEDKTVTYGKACELLRVFLDKRQPVLLASILKTLLHMRTPAYPASSVPAAGIYIYILPELMLYICLFMC